MIIRDLVARFAFETDTRGIREFDRHLATTREGLRQLAGIVNTVAGSGGLLALGANLEAARAQARRFGAQVDESGALTGRLGEQVQDLKAELGNFSDQDVLAAFAAFGELADGMPQVEGRFAEAFDHIVHIAKASGREVRAVMAEMASAVRAGDAAGFLERLPGITPAQALQARQALEARQHAPQPASTRQPHPGMDVLLSQLQALAPQVRQQADRTDEGTLGGFDAARKRLEDRLGGLGVRLLAKLGTELDLLDAINTRGSSSAGAILGKLRDQANQMEDGAADAARTVGHFLDVMARAPVPEDPATPSAAAPATPMSAAHEAPAPGPATTADRDARPPKDTHPGTEPVYQAQRRQTAPPTPVTEATDQLPASAAAADRSTRIEVHAPITINGAQDAVQVARLARQELEHVLARTLLDIQPLEGTA